MLEAIPNQGLSPMFEISQVTFADGVKGVIKPFYSSSYLALLSSSSSSISCFASIQAPKDDWVLYFCVFCSRQFKRLGLSHRCRKWAIISTTDSAPTSMLKLSHIRQSLAEITGLPINSMLLMSRGEVIRLSYLDLPGLLYSQHIPLIYMDTSHIQKISLSYPDYWTLRLTLQVNSNNGSVLILTVYSYLGYTQSISIQSVPSPLLSRIYLTMWTINRSKTLSLESSSSSHIVA